MATPRKPATPPEETPPPEEDKERESLVATIKEVVLGLFEAGDLEVDDQEETGKEEPKEKEPLTLRDIEEAAKRAVRAVLPGPTADKEVATKPEETSAPETIPATKRRIEAFFGWGGQ